MGTQMPVAMRLKYEEMVKDKFSSLIADAQVLHQEERDLLKHKLKTKRGIYKLEAEIAATEVKLRELKNSLEDRSGYNDKKILSDVDRLLEQKSGVYSRLISEQNKAVDSIWLAGAPESVVAILEDLKGILPRLQKQLMADETKKLKK